MKLIIWEASDGNGVWRDRDESHYTGSKEPFSHKQWETIVILGRVRLRYTVPVIKC